MTITVLDASGPNAEQIRYWNDTAASKWVELQRFIDDLIGPLGHVALDAADLRAGERILDVGCGCGNTTMDLARRVGPTGSVLGVDISGVMLEEARRACQQQGMANASFHQADAVLVGVRTTYVKYRSLLTRACHLIASRSIGRMKLAGNAAIDRFDEVMALGGNV